MTERMPSRRLACATTLIMLVSLALGAAVARAAGEDDPTFGTGGAAYQSLPDGSFAFSPQFVDQAPAPDGHIYAAIGSTRFAQNNLRGTTVGTIQVARFDSSGQPAGYGGDGRAEFGFELGFGRLQSMRAFGDGRVLLVAQVFNLGDFEQNEERGGPPGTGPDGIGLMLVNADGTVASQDLFGPPPECGESEEPYAASSAVASAERVYVMWEDCDEGRLVTAVEVGDGVQDTGDLGDETHARTSNFLDGIRASDVAVAPDGTVYGMTYLGTPIRGDLPTFSLLYRFTADLDEVDGWPEQVNGFPIDLDVDGQNRPVAWMASFAFSDRGNSDGWTFLRLRTDGEPDTGFGGDGVVTFTGEAFGPAGRGVNDGEPPRWSHIGAMTDGRIIAVGVPEGDPGRGFGQGGPRTVIRLLANGDLDPDWGTDGIRTFDVSGTDSFLADLNGPSIQGDGKVLLPFVAGRGAARVPGPPENGGFLGVARLTGTDPPAEEPEQPQQPVQPGQPVIVPPAVPGAAPSQTAAPSRTCKSRRRFRIRLRTGRRKAERSPIASAQVTVNGRRVRVTRRARQTSTVNLTNLPKGRFTVRIRLRLKDGGIVRETRRYRTCTKKIERELGPLRTRAPRKRR